MTQPISIIIATALIIALARFTVHTPHDLSLDWARSYEAGAHLWSGYLLAVVFYRRGIQTTPTPSLNRWLAAGAVFATTALEVALWLVR